MFTLPASFNAMKRTTFVVVLSCLFVASLTAQAQTLTLGSVQACAAPEVLVPVTGANLPDVGSLTLFITFDSTRLTYQSIDNIDTQLGGIVYSLNTTPFQLAIVWSKITPAQFMQKKLFDIRFSFKGEMAPVTFKSSCEVTNSQLQILTVSFLNGSVASGLPQITRQPKDTMVRPWALANFSTLAGNVQGYLWKVSSDNGLTWSSLSDNQIYAGTQSSQLTLKYVPPAFNKYRYLCSLNNQGCNTVTGQVTLSVDSVASVRDLAGANDLLLQNRPNPVTSLTNIEYTLPENGSVIIEIMDLCGRIIANPVREPQSTGIHSICFDATRLQPGLYFYNLRFRNENINYITSGKLIKSS